jgi:hypothetical protein
LACSSGIDRLIADDIPAGARDTAGAQTFRRFQPRGVANMGHTIWVEVRGRPLKETADDSSIMHRLMDSLDELAGRLGLRKLSDFYDSSELEAAYGDFDDDAEDDSDEEPAAEPTLEEGQSKGDWFDSATGLDSVRRIRERLTEQFDDLGFKPEPSTTHWPKQLMEELERTERILTDAASRNQSFRLLIVP